MQNILLIETMNICLLISYHCAIRVPDHVFYRWLHLNACREGFHQLTIKFNWYALQHKNVSIVKGKKSNLRGERVKLCWSFFKLFLRSSLLPSPIIIAAAELFGVLSIRNSEGAEADKYIWFSFHIHVIKERWCTYVGQFWVKF